MISKRYIDQYLDRQIESISWIKDLTPLEIEEELSYIKPKPKFTAPLRHEQKVCFYMGIADPGLAFLLDLGLGKTSISLELLSYFYHNKFIRRAFVFASSDELVEGWEDEILKWKFTIPYLTLRKGSSKNKWKQVDEFGDGIIIGTYVGIASMVSSIQPVLNKSTGKVKNKRIIKKELVDELTKNVDACVYDQSTKIGNISSLSAKCCLRFSNKAQINYALAGRAFGKDPILLFNQFRLVDKGRAFGRNLGLFREAFYRQEQHQWGSNWVLRKRREKILSHFCTASSIRYGIEECQELPERIPIIKKCDLPDNTWKYYDQLVDDLVKSRGNYREVKNVVLRLRQISSGFVGFIDDETGDRAQIEFDENPKLDLLEEVIEELPPDRKMIIYHEYTWSGSKICQMLAKQKVKHGWLWSGTKNWTKIKDEYNNDPEFRVLVANWRKGSMGLNLQTGNYMCFYESPMSVIERAESEGRQRRTGQKNKCFVIDLVVKDTFDEDILESHREGSDLWKRIVDNPNLIRKRKK